MDNAIKVEGGVKPELVETIQLNAAQVEALHRWHDAMSGEYECEAALEGQLCCVDMLLKWHGVEPAAP